MNNPDTLNPFYNSFVQFAGDVPGKDLHSDIGFGIFYCCINYERYCKVMLRQTMERSISFFVAGNNMFQYFPRMRFLWAIVKFIS